MNNKIRPADNISRTYSRGLVLTTLEMEVILIGIKVVGSGYIVVETKTWDQYWNPLCGLQIGGLKQHLNAFHVAWRSYIKSGFHASKQQEYCFRYFRLLNVLLAGHQSKTHSNLLKKALRTVLGFECFGVSTNNSDVVAAGTTTLRNPCYLLAKLKMPDAIDDTQFLPIITLEHTERPELFYHYRQHSLSLDSSIALLLYVAVSREIRSSSFKTISTFVGRITYGVDPRGHERARRLGRAIVRPIIEEHKTGHYTSGVCRHWGWKRTSNVESLSTGSNAWCVDGIHA